MIKLFTTEFLRYRDRALVVALVHFVLAAALEMLGGGITTAPAFNAWFMGCMAAAAGFGILQMNSHKRINHWVYLLQRPLAPWKIATAIAGAGGAVVLIALVLPFAPTLARLQWLEAGPLIELRHYLQLAHIAAAVLLAYVYASFCALYTHKLKFIGFILFLFAAANRVEMNVNVVLLLLALIALVCFYGWFEPDLGKGATKPAFIVVSELPLHFGLFWGFIVIHSALLDVSWSLFDNGPYSTAAPGTLASLQLKNGREIMLAALEGDSSADAAFYRRQIALGEVEQVTPPHGRSFPTRNQRPSLDNGLSLTDPRGAATWHFSHSEMLFRGSDGESGTELGWLGPEGFSTELPNAARFTSVPWVTQNRFILDDQTIYQLDWEQRALRQKFSLATLDAHAAATSGERFSDSLGFSGNVVTLRSNRNLYLFRSGQFGDFAETPVLETRLPLAAPDGPVRTSIYVMELIDGYLVAQLVGVAPDLTEGDFVTFDRARLILHETGATRGNAILADRALTSGFGASTIYEGFVLAPGFRLLNDLADGIALGWNSQAALPLLHHRFPPLVLLLAFCSMLVSGLVVQRLVRPLALPRAAKLAWIAVSAFSGLIGLAGFYFGTYRGALSLQLKPEKLAGQPPANEEAGHA